MQNTCFPPESLEFGYMVSRGCHMTSYNKNSQHQVSKELDISHVFLQFIAGRIKSTLCDSTGRGLWEACMCFLVNFSPCVFPF